MAIDTIKASAILDGAVDTADIANDAVTTTKIADSQVTTAKINDDAVTTAKIASGAVDTTEIASGAVTSAKLDTNIDVAGTLDVTGALTADSTIDVTGVATLRNDISLNSTGEIEIQRPNTANNLIIKGTDSTPNDRNAFVLDNVGFPYYTDYVGGSAFSTGFANYSDGFWKCMAFRKFTNSTTYTFNNIGVSQVPVMFKVYEHTYGSLSWFQIWGNGGAGVAYRFTGFDPDGSFFTNTNGFSVSWTDQGSSSNSYQFSASGGNGRPVFTFGHNNDVTVYIFQFVHKQGTGTDGQYEN